MEIFQNILPSVEIHNLLTKDWKLQIQWSLKINLVLDYWGNGNQNFQSLKYQISRTPLRPPRWISLPNAESHPMLLGMLPAVYLELKLHWSGRVLKWKKHVFCVNWWSYDFNFVWQGKCACTNFLKDDFKGKRWSGTSMSSVAGLKLKRAKEHWHLPALDSPSLNHAGRAETDYFRPWLPFQ